MADVFGSLHFLALIGLTGAWVERRIRPWPQWTAPLGLLVFLVMTFLYAAAVAIGYGAM